MFKTLFTTLSMLCVSWLFACPTSAQDLTPPAPYQISEVPRGPRCPDHGTRCFLAGRGATASQMLSQVNRGIADPSRRVTMADLEAANPCDISYVRDDGSAKRNGLCPVMNGTTERVTWENFCDGHHACQRWVIASYPGHLRIYSVPKRHRRIVSESVAETARAPDVPQAVVTAPIPVVATAPLMGAAAPVQVATSPPAPDPSLERRIVQLTRERDDARRASGTDWTLSGVMVALLLGLLVASFYLGSSRTKVTTVNLSENENRAWNDKVQEAERKTEAAIRRAQEAENSVRDELRLANEDIAPFRVLQGLYKSKMNADLTPQRLDETIRGFKAHAVLETALGGLSVGSVKQAVLEAGIYRNLKAAWEVNFLGTGFNQLAIANVPVKHKQEIEALCATHNAEIEDLRRKAPQSANGQNDDGMERLLNRLSADVWKPLCALTGDFRSLLTTDKNGVCTLNPTVDPEKVKIRFGKIQNGGKLDKSEKKLQQLTVFLNRAYNQCVQVREATNEIIAGPPDSDLASLYDDRDDEPTGEIVLERDASGANALPADPTRLTDTGEKPEPET